MYYLPIHYLWTMKHLKGGATWQCLGISPRGAWETIDCGGHWTKVSYRKTTHWFQYDLSGSDLPSLYVMEQKFSHLTETLFLRTEFRDDVHELEWCSNRRMEEESICRRERKTETQRDKDTERWRHRETETQIDRGGGREKEWEEKLRDQALWYHQSIKHRDKRGEHRELALRAWSTGLDLTKKIHGSPDSDLSRVWSDVSGGLFWWLAGRHTLRKQIGCSFCRVPRYCREDGGWCISSEFTGVHEWSRKFPTSMKNPEEPPYPVGWSGSLRTGFTSWILWKVTLGTMTLL